MTILLTILHVIVCFALISVILLQAGRGQGLASSSFGGGNVQSVFGTKAADFLTKATTFAAIGFLLTCIGLDYLEVRKSRSLIQATEKSAPIDIDQIKKALEKVKEQAPAEVAAELGDNAEVVTQEAVQLQEEVAESVSEQLPVEEVEAPEIPQTS